MADLIDKATQEQLTDIFAQMQSDVTLKYFTQAPCPTYAQQHGLLEAIASLSAKLSLETFDLDSEEARHYRIDKTPATLIITDRDPGIRFFGITAGHEFSSFVQSVILAATETTALPPELMGILSEIDVPLHFEIMTTLTCPYCAKMVVTANQLALANDLIRVDMIDSAEFPDLVERYGVKGVPKTIINGDASFEGALPIPNVILELLKVARPERYEAIARMMEKALDARASRPAIMDKLYDIIIVGAGPAAMTAAIYAARKELTKEKGVFRLHTQEARRYQARSVIYCAGKTYRRLDIEGEEQFIGNAIAFCATCDAPLFKDRSVAVVGGDNSALTAARDLLGFAKTVHLINRSDTFHADKVLLDEVLASDIVQTHLDTNIKAFKGTDRLASIEIYTDDANNSHALAIEGVFLEIGLTPNSAPLKELAELNERGEVIVDKQQATSVEGLFAAGDVTDEIDKQIIIAAGAGAKAALSAERYLLSLQ